MSDKKKKKETEEKKTEEKKTEDTISVCHYTTKENAAAIIKSGEIRPSSSGAFGGNKVYLTTMEPSSGKKAIARNNYDDKKVLWEGREAAGSVDACIKVTLPANKVQKERDPLGRDIYTHKGPVKLGDNETENKREREREREREKQ